MINTGTYAGISFEQHCVECIAGTGLTLMYEEMNCRRPKGRCTKHTAPLKVTSTMLATRPYAAFSHCPWDL
jgi:hypothetical protein